MKTKIIAIVSTIFGFILGIVFTGITVSYSAGEMMIKEIKSPLDYDKTIETIVYRLENSQKWHVVEVYDMNQEVIKHGGEPIGRLSIIKYCSGPYASEMLKSDDRKKLAAMMPKAFAVYEKENGEVFVSTANGAVMGKLFGGETEEIIERVSVEIEQVLSFMNFKFSIL
ncbi:MAG: DUF302 domain-containing protein [Bacteroidales bacterium]|nr:DUF302 domain-containing protein [Bacteroidales bacterium]